MVHCLKILPEYFDEVNLNKKRFELRKNDRNFAVDDILFLEECQNGVYTGRHCLRFVTSVLSDVEKFGLKKGFVILSIA